jgi:hypothetical protein
MQYHRFDQRLHISAPHIEALGGHKRLEFIEIHVAQDFRVGIRRLRKGGVFMFGQNGR